MITFNPLLKTLKEKGMTRIELAEAMEIGGRKLYDSINGKSSPSVKFIEDICKTLSVQIEDVIEWVPDEIQ